MNELCPHASRLAVRSLIILALLTFAQTFAQRVVELRGFKYSEYYDAPQETRVKTRLQGAKARPEQGGQVVVTGARLETFREDGSPELIMEAPECTHDAATKTITSSGPLLVKMADGSFSIHGDGFHFEQTNSVLSISNNVETVVQPNLLQGHEGQHQPQPGSQAGAPLNVNSDRFRYSRGEGLGVYSGNVRVTGTNLAVKCGALTLKLPVEERRLHSIEAAENVDMNYAGMNATGQHATYNVDTGIAEVTGGPTWSTEGREGRADKFTIDRTNRLVIAEGNAWLRMPGQTLAANVLPSIDSVNTNSSGGVQSVEVRSDMYELRTNTAVFKRQVLVTEMAGREIAGHLACAQLNAFFSSTNQLDRLVALGGAKISRGDNHLLAREAVYTATNSLLELIDNPSWQAGPRQGRGREISVDTAKNIMHVRGDAYLSMPAESFSAATLAEGKDVKPVNLEGQIAEITSAEYDLGQRQAVFRNNVLVKHPQTIMACRVLTVDMPPQGGHVERIFAEQKVTFDLIDASGKRVNGTTDRATYSYAISGSRTNEQLQLAGNTILKHTNMVLQSQVVYYNRAENKVGAPNWTMRGTIPSGKTNQFTFPKLK